MINNMMRYLFSFFLMLFFLPLFANAKESLVVDYYTLARYEEKQVKPYVEHWRLSVNDKCSVFAQPCWFSHLRFFLLHSQCQLILRLSLCCLPLFHLFYLLLNIYYDIFLRLLQLFEIF